MSQTTSRLQEEIQTPKAQQRGTKLRFLIPLALLLLGVGVGVRYYFLNQPQDNELELSGRIEGYETNIGTKVGGRIESIAVREGDRVKQGQVIAKLDDAELKAQLAGAKARLNSAQQQLKQARLQIEVIESQIAQAKLNLRQSSDDATGKINQAQANIAATKAATAEAQAQVRQAEAEKQLAQIDRDRYQSLLQDGVISQQQFDQSQTKLITAQANLEAAKAAVEAAEKQVNVAEGELTQAQTSSFNPEINTAKIAGLNKQLAQAEAQLEAAQAEVANTKAAQAEITAKLNDLKITSPLTGIVSTRTSEPGEVIATGTTLMSLIDLNDVYLRGYLPQGEIGLIRVGQPAEVFLDSAPNKPLAATVAEIDSQASFTPENIYFRSDRVTQVFGLKLKIDNPQGFAKPGMPADGEIVKQ
ncbi:HlyD family secretion protein [Chondrocystis sp. NIES-4102]|nr:HlyD family secretion protein [Chondrocystis sp. NIES-4102]